VETSGLDAIPAQWAGDKQEDAMNWNSSQRNANEYKSGTRQRLLAILAAQGVLTEELLANARDRDSDTDDDILEIEITEFEGCLGADDEADEDLDELDEDEAEEDADEEENEASGSGRRPSAAARSGSAGKPQQGGERGKKRQSQ
jgi:hypothetical protein